MKVDIVITGSNELLRKLEHLKDGLDDWHVAFTEMGDEMVMYYQDRVFTSMGGVFGVKWPALAPSTQRFKSKNFRQYTAVPLMATGTMRHSFKKLVRPLSLKVFNKAPQFVYHQSTEPRTKIPRRQMLGINGGIKSIIRQSIRNDLKRKIESL